MTIEYPLDRVIPEHGPRLRKVPLACMIAPVPSVEMRPVADWQHLRNPTDRQVGPRCGGNATENAAEIMLRRDAPQDWLHAEILKRLGHLRWRVNGNGLYDAVRAALRSGSSEDGLSQDEISRIPEVTGIFWHHGVRRIPAIAATRHSCLKDGPICVPLAVGPHWNEPDPENGMIESVGFDPLTMPAGHELCLIGAWTQGVQAFDLPLNSWGETWGRYGCGLLNAYYTDYCHLADGTQWVVEDEWWKKGTILDWIISSDA